MSTSQVTTPPKGSRAGLTPIAPVLHRQSIGIRGRRADDYASLLDAPHRLLTTSGRAAIAIALEELAIGAGAEVLLPSYHCGAMIGPILARGARPVFYRVTSSLQIDIDDLEAKRTASTRCVIAVHFFGFPTPLDSLRRWCDTHGIALIEDCAHAFFGPAQDPIGRTGDFAIGSVMKFFPVFDGGCLTSCRRSIGGALRKNSVAFEIKSTLDLLERSSQWSRSSVPRAAFGAVRYVRKGLKAATPSLANKIGNAAPAASSGGLHFEAAWTRASMSAISRWVVAQSDQQRIVARRRRLFAAYLDAVADLPGCRPFHSTLPDGVVPYVFPLLLTEPDESFEALWGAGIPLYRWEELDDGQCDVARHYRAALVQLPCHQELTDEQERWLVSTLRATFGRSAH